MGIPSQRAIRVSTLVRAQIANSIQTKLSKTVGFVSIVELVMTNDLSLARVYISVLGDDKLQTLKKLQQSAGFIKKEIGINLNLRKVPALRFYLDDRLEKGDKILQKIKELNLPSQTNPTQNKVEG